MYLLEQFFLIWKRHNPGDANYTFYVGYVCNFRQYLYFSVSVSSASVLQLGFVRCTLRLLYLKLIFGNFESFGFLMKIYSKSSEIFVFTLSKKEQYWLWNSFLNSKIVGRGEMPYSLLNIICNVESI